ncbi:GlxA family transcriptional regulator [Mesorhizobium shangrilense]|uniref:GlxA family transcriptional regulator n=1 Tax=Mesorhizobium shangrilense TaxID=460060 RepID=A0ABV2DIN2_9HYPH
MNMIAQIKDETTTITRDIAFVVYPQFQVQDLSGPLSAFENAGRQHGFGPYNLHVVSRDGGLIASSSGLAVATEAIRPEPYDTIILTGGDVLANPAEFEFAIDGTISKSVRTARRVASVCTGAFLLAATGLLNGRRATTHWRYVGQLQRMFPKIKVDGDRIFTKDGDVWTSAGVTAGIDLALAMIEEDLGTEVPKRVAQMLVVYHRRPGGQSQFSAMLDMEPASDRIRTVLTYIREHLTDTLSTERLADVAHLSPRQFGRSFLTETGETPAKAVERLRAEVARVRVERGVEPIEVIARHVGFADPERMRRAFVRIFGHPPQSLRRMATKPVFSEGT